MVTLLRDGFGFEPESRDITFTFLVDGSEVDWSLGFSISHFAEDHKHAVSVKKTEVEMADVQDEYDCSNKSEWSSASGTEIGKLFWSAHSKIWQNAHYLSKRFQAASTAIYT